MAGSTRILCGSSFLDEMGVRASDPCDHWNAWQKPTAVDGPRLGPVTTCLRGRYFDGQQVATQTTVHVNLCCFTRFSHLGLMGCQCPKFLVSTVVGFHG